MKYLIRLTLAITLILASLVSVQARDLGLQVKSIPKGTTAHYVNQSGKKFKYKFLGKVGKLYMIRVSGSQNYERFYDSNGFLVKISQKGFYVKYKPYYCSRKMGKCTFDYDAEYSKYQGKWIGVLSKTKDGYQYKYERINDKSDGQVTVFYKFGKYNFLSEYVSGSRWYRLEKITVAK